AAPRARVHEHPLPRPRRDEHPHHRRDRPEVRHGRVQGSGDPHREGDRVVDLRLLSAEPTAAEREAIDSVVGPLSANGAGRAVHGGHALRELRHLLLPALRAAQRRVGWVSEGALGYASRRLDVPPADAYGVASFYHLLAL